VPLERLSDLFRIVLPWAAGALIAAAAYRLVPRLAPALRLLPGRPRLRLGGRPVPEAWRGILARNVPLADSLDDADREHLLRLVRLFLHEIPFEGVGVELTDEIRVTIAAQAALPLLRLEYPRYPRLRRVLVYQGVFQPRRIETLDFGTIHREPVASLGEAWTGGIVVLSWESSLMGSLDPADGQNVVLHEFAHVLDGENGEMDGIPVLERTSEYRRWRRVFAAAYERELRAVEDGGDPPLHPYAATNRAEFFAVATEAFFERPRELATRLPELHEELRRFFRQDPGARLPPALPGSSAIP
jgi:Mlc titration factor MtfA (ptsG expression regulator)